jgi:hypothetical protein
LQLLQQALLHLLLAPPSPPLEQLASLRQLEVSQLVKALVSFRRHLLLEFRQSVSLGQP